LAGETNEHRDGLLGIPKDCGAYGSESFSNHALVLQMKTSPVTGHGGEDAEECDSDPGVRPGSGSKEPEIWVCQLSALGRDAGAHLRLARARARDVGARARTGAANLRVVRPRGLRGAMAGRTSLWSDRMVQTRMIWSSRSLSGLYPTSTCTPHPSARSEPPRYSQSQPGVAGQGWRDRKRAASTALPGRSGAPNRPACCVRAFVGARAPMVAPYPTPAPPHYIFRVLCVRGWGSSW
jgi:hypothetical protein